MPFPRPAAAGALRMLARWLVAGIGAWGAAVAVAQTPEACKGIDREAERLACYDNASGRYRREDGTVAEPPPLPSLLSFMWDLDESDDQQRYTLRSHHTNYLLPFHYTSDTNPRPYSPVLGPTTMQDPSPAGVKFQLSIKTRVMERLFGRVDLWMAYTQQAHWQLFLDSGPFREINHLPEVMALYRLDTNFLGADLRFLNFGVSHHSNGRDGAASRSWNRFYVQLGLDYGEHVAVLIRPWVRLTELERIDTNPDMTSYYGRSEIAGFYRVGRNAIGLTLRSTLSLNGSRGAAQLDWYFPLYKQLRGYVQVFSGYGESLIDYNHRQNTIGVGVALVDWLWK